MTTDAHEVDKNTRIHRRQYRRGQSKHYTRRWRVEDRVILSDESKNDLSSHIQNKSTNTRIVEGELPAKICAEGGCQNIKDMSATEYILNGKRGSKEHHAITGMCLMKVQEKFSFDCILCGQRVRLPKNYHYNMYDNIIQDTPGGKCVVSNVRRHCEQEHPTLWMWNALPAKTNMEIAPLEALIHEAMKQASFDVRIPEKLCMVEFCVAFQCRIERAIDWVRWNKTCYVKLKSIRGDYSLRVTAINILEDISIRTVTLMQTKVFDDAMKTHTLDQLYNILQLFFCMQGRYKTCSIFSTPSPTVDGRENGSESDTSIII